MSPFECWLILRGVKTLAVRMKQHDENGRIVADFLANHRKVKKVFYPGLKTHPQFALARKQMSGFGSMITFETGSLNNAASDVEEGEGLHVRRIAWRRRDIDLASCHDDTRRNRSRRTQEDRTHRRDGADLRRG